MTLVQVLLSDCLGLRQLALLGASMSFLIEAQELLERRKATVMHTFELVALLLRFIPLYNQQVSHHAQASSRPQSRSNLRFKRFARGRFGRSGIVRVSTDRLSVSREAI